MEVAAFFRLHLFHKTHNLSWHVVLLVLACDLNVYIESVLEACREWPRNEKAKESCLLWPEPCLCLVDPRGPPEAVVVIPALEFCLCNEFRFRSRSSWSGGRIKSVLEVVLLWPPPLLGGIVSAVSPSSGLINLYQTIQIIQKGDFWLNSYLRQSPQWSEYQT
jgi:hypothetical protein